jgi:hypothetical protein
MEILGRQDRSNEASPLVYEPSASHVVRGPKRKSLRTEARRRRIMANVFFVCSSAVTLAVVGICYALLRQ